MNFLLHHFSVSNNKRQNTDKSFSYKVPQARNIFHKYVLLLLLYITILKVIKSSFKEKDLSRKIKLNWQKVLWKIEDFDLNWCVAKSNIFVDFNNGKVLLMTLIEAAEKINFPLQNIVDLRMNINFFCFSVSLNAKANGNI